MWIVLKTNWYKFISISVKYLIEFGKTCQLCYKIDTQVHALPESSASGRTPCSWRVVRSLNWQALLALKPGPGQRNPRGLMSRQVPACSPATNLSKGVLQMNVSVWRAQRMGRVGFWNPSASWHFLGGANVLFILVDSLRWRIGSQAFTLSHLSYWANSLWLEGGRVSKVCLWVRGLDLHCRNLLARFSLWGQTLPIIKPAWLRKM